MAFIQEIALDRWNATQLATQLMADGFEVVAFGQGYASMNWPCKKLENWCSLGALPTAASRCCGGWPVT